MTQALPRGLKSRKHIDRDADPGERPANQLRQTRMIFDECNPVHEAKAGRSMEAILPADVLQTTFSARALRHRIV